MKRGRDPQRMYRRILSSYWTNDFDDYLFTFFLRIAHPVPYIMLSSAQQNNKLRKEEEEAERRMLSRCLAFVRQHSAVLRSCASHLSVAFDSLVFLAFSVILFAAFVYFHFRENVCCTIPVYEPENKIADGRASVRHAPSGETGSCKTCKFSPKKRKKKKDKENQIKYKNTAERKENRRQ